MVPDKEVFHECFQDHLMNEEPEYWFEDVCEDDEDVVFEHAKALEKSLAKGVEVRFKYHVLEKCNKDTGSAGEVPEMFKCMNDVLQNALVDFADQYESEVGHDPKKMLEKLKPHRAEAARCLLACIEEGMRIILSKQPPNRS
jgi:hypothetical protein